MVHLKSLRLFIQLGVVPLLCLVGLCLIGGAVSAAEPAPIKWQAVLVAGDDAQPVFDNAVESFARWLTSHNVANSDIHRLTATPGPQHPGAEPASARLILQWISSLHPGPGEGCLVFVTSHGSHDEGAWLAYSGEFLRPSALAQALSSGGCAGAPTVVIISACYSGSFAKGAMRAPNRIILTAARADRSSFGCQATRTYTVFDECLLGSLNRATKWQALSQINLACVREHERELQVMPSQPQVFVGAAARNLPLN